MGGLPTVRALLHIIHTHARLSPLRLPSLSRCHQSPSPPHRQSWRTTRVPRVALALPLRFALSSRVRTAMICPPAPTTPQTLQIHLYHVTSSTVGQQAGEAERQGEEKGGPDEGYVLRDLTHQLWALTFLPYSPAFL